MLKMSRYRLLASICVAGALCATGQVIPLQPVQQPIQTLPQQPVVQSLRPDYPLGPNDQILVRSPNSEELNDRPFRVDSEGFINFPLINRIQVTGMTVQALEAEMVNRLRQFFVQPQVGITITGFRSETASFFGAFVRPGVYSLTGGRTLLEMLAVVGGFQPSATRRIRVTRRAEYGPIPLPSAIVDQTNQTSTVEINLDNLLRELNPAEDIVLQAFDRVTVDAAQPVFVNGEVTRPAAIELAGKESIGIMQALTQAGGLTATARRSKIRVLRPVEGTARLAPIDIDIARIVEGLDNDFPLFPNDILYVPRVSGMMALLPQAGSALISNIPFVIITALTGLNR